jgi:hypothetical protein
MKQKRPPTTAGCAPGRDGRAPKTYAEVVAKYIAEDQNRGDQDLAWFAGQPDFDTLLEKAVMSRTRNADTGKEMRHPHQRRIPEAVLRKAHRALSGCDLQSCRSFDELHDLIEHATSKIKGIGALAVFDFACRVGAWRRPPLQPDKVYLHSGTRVGANALERGRGRKSIEVHDLPPEFHGLSGRHAEDCLCIFKDDLKRIASRRAR